MNNIWIRVAIGAAIGCLGCIIGEMMGAPLWLWATILIFISFALDKALGPCRTQAN